MATKRQEYDRKRYEIKQLKEGINPRKYKTGELDKQLENAKQIFIGREMERNESKLRDMNPNGSSVKRNGYQEEKKVLMFGQGAEQIRKTFRRYGEPSRFSGQGLSDIPHESTIDFDVIDREFNKMYSLEELSNLGLDNAISYLRQTAKNYGIEPDDVNQATNQIHEFMSEHDETDYHDKIYKCEIVCIYLAAKMIKEEVELTPSTISYFLKVYLKMRESPTMYRRF